MGLQLLQSGAPDGKNVTLLRFWVVSAVTPFERFFQTLALPLRDVDEFGEKRAFGLGEDLGGNL